MDLKTSGLSGVNEKFNNILKKVESVADTMKAQIQADASAAAAAIGGDLSALTGELRNLIPEGAALPNINLQSQLSSLASISNPAQAANLLSSITSNFGTELSASGFDLGTLVSDTKAAIAGGKSLSFSIPNFEKPADGVSAAFQKAVAVKVPDKDTVKETVATFVENTKLTATKSTASSSVISVSSTPPTEDTEQIKITEKTTNITQQGITSKVTIAKDAVVTTTTSGGGSKTISRKNFSKNGFVTKQIRVTEYIHVDDVLDTEGLVEGAEMNFELSSKPIRIGKLKGFDQTTKRSKTIRSFPTRRADRFDTFVVNEKKITISNSIGIDYDEFEENSFGKDYGYPDGTMFVVSYYTLSNYDPDYKTDEVEV
jgi:hypothetical protein